VTARTQTFGSYIVQETPTDATWCQAVVEGPSGIDRKMEVIVQARSYEAAVFFARAAAGASSDDLKKDPFMAPEPILEAPTPVITEGTKF